MDCRNHPGTEAVDRCAGCAEPFCPDCLVDIQGQRYCGECKVMALRDGPPPLPEDQTRECVEAGQALKYAIIGIFCFGMILGPVAIVKALKAKRMIEEDPRLSGSGKATAALWIGIVVFFLWALGMVAKFAQA